MKENKYLNCSFTDPKLFEIDTTLESRDLADLLIHDTEHTQVWKVVHAHHSRKSKEEDLEFFHLHTTTQLEFVIVDTI